MLRMANCSIIWLLAILLLLQVLHGLTAPFSTCTNLEINSAQITNIPYFGYGSTNTTTVPLVNAQPDSIYFAYATFQQFELSQANFSISVLMNVAFMSTSSITLNFTGMDSGGFVTQIRIAYLIIPSTCTSEIQGIFSSCCYSTNCTPTTIQPSGTTLNILYTFPTALVLPVASYGTFLFTNSIFLQTSDYPTNHFGQSVGITIINSTHYTLDFTNTSPVTMTLSFSLTSIIIYQLPTSSLRMIISVSSIDEITPTAIVPDISNTFFGLTSYSFINGKMNFFVSSANQTMTLTFGTQLQTIKVSLLKFGLRKCYGTTPYIDTAQSICVDSCLTRTYLLNNTINCLPCSYDCLSCDNNFTCLTCSSNDFRVYNPTTSKCDPIFNYFDPDTTVAARCLYPNCCGSNPIKFYQNSTCLNICPQNYSYNPQNKSCGECNPGYWPVSNICTNIIGCIAIFVSNSTVGCSICDSSAKFTLDNRTCFCLQGYQYSTDSRSCKEVCGDGFHFSEQCDDGNEISGDGCSSSCTLETHFRCTSNSSKDPSKCLFVASNIKLSLSWANKTAGKNQGIFSFKAFTLYARLNHTKLYLSCNFTSDPAPTSTRITSTYNEILVYADYDQDLQGKMAQLSLQINPDYIENVKKLQTIFTMSSAGVKLVVIHYYPIITTISQIIKILSYVVLGIFLTSSLAYKMFGVQILHSFLIIYFVCIQTLYQTEAYMHFSFFKPINLSLMENSDSFYSSSTASSYQIQDQLITKIMMTAVMLFPIVIVVIVKTAVVLKNSNTKPEHAQQILIEEQPQIVKNTKQWSYNMFLFPISIGFLHYAIFPAFIVSNSDQNKKYFQNNIHFIIFERILLTLLCSFVYFTEFKKIFTSRQINTQQILKHTKLYQSVYLVFWLGVCVILSIDCLYKISWLQQALLLLYSQYTFFWFLQKKPYRRGIDNFGQLTNLVTIVFFLSFSVARKYFSIFQQEGFEIISIFLILLSMTVTLLITLFRTFIRFRQVYKYFTKIENAKIKQNNEQRQNMAVENVLDILQSENRYRLKNMLINQRLINFNCEQALENRDEVRRQIFNQMKSSYIRNNNNPY